MSGALAFYTLGGLILIFALLVVMARNTVHCILFLVADFLAVALLYASMNSMFVAAIQVLVYAGGIVVLYLFVVMLVNLKRPPEANADPRRQGWVGFALAGLVLAELGGILVLGRVAAPEGAGFIMETSDLAINNVERIGMLLYSDYLIPFEVASMLLLVAMVGAIILARREL